MFINVDGRALCLNGEFLNGEYGQRTYFEGTHRSARSTMRFGMLPKQHSYRAAPIYRVIYRIIRIISDESGVLYIRVPDKKFLLRNVHHERGPIFAISIFSECRTGVKSKGNESNWIIRLEILN